MLVEFYAPWCGHCKKLTPDYAAAARTLREHKQKVQLVKVDATEQKELGKKYDITGFPTLKWWPMGADMPVEYDGPRDHAGIVTWIRQKIDPKFKPPPSDVKALTKADFDAFVGDKELVLVEFYAPWCGHCKKLEPELEIAARRLIVNNPVIHVAKVDATQEPDLAKEYGVSGYPTIKLLRKGKRFEYNGPREADGIIAYMREQAKPAARPLDSLKSAKRACTHSDDIAVLGFFASEDDRAFENFVAAGEELRETYKTYMYTTDAEIIKGMDAKAGTVCVCVPTKWASKYEEQYNEMKAVSCSSFVSKKYARIGGRLARGHRRLHPEAQHTAGRPPRTQAAAAFRRPATAGCRVLRGGLQSGAH